MKTPLPSGARFDLHLHSDRSDGRLPSEQVLRMCAQGGLDVIALTDHDTPPVLPSGRQRVAGRDIHVLHAAEVSGAHDGREFHLLVYFRGDMPEPFRQLLRSLGRARVDRYRQAVAALGLDGIPDPPPDAIDGDRAITRVHLSEAIVAAGHASDLGDCFQRYTGNDTGMVPPVSLDFRAAIRLARAAGGFTSWAHPSVDDAKAHLATFAAAGLQAIEAARPTLRPIDRNALLRMAHRRGLLVTGGSDFHGFSRNRPPGSWSFPVREARPFARAMGFSV